MLPVDAPSLDVADARFTANLWRGEDVRVVGHLHLQGKMCMFVYILMHCLLLEPKQHVRTQCALFRRAERRIAQVSGVPRLCNKLTSFGAYLAH